MTPEEKLAMALQLAEKVVSAANIVSHDGYYELDYDAVTVVLSEAIDRMQERVRAETGWQDIATAPKDGTLIDVWRGGEFPRRVPDVSWREPTDSEWWVHGGDTIRTPAATWHDMFGPFGKDDTPTHWRPLPSPPAIRETPHAEG